MFGCIIPRDSPVAIALKRDLSAVVTTLLLPPFFAFTGMRTLINFGSGADYWVACAALILVAAAGKIGGAMLSGRLTGMTWRHAAGLGVLMNTRGLMELIVLNIGLDLGIITPTFFSMMVLMAVVTTLMTVPGLSLLDSGRRLQPPEQQRQPGRMPRPSRREPARPPTGCERNAPPLNEHEHERFCRDTSNDPRPRFRHA